jgi:hypothetical protein
MAENCEARLLSGANAFHNADDHFLEALSPPLSLGVKVGERLGAGVQLADYVRGRGVMDQVENCFRYLDPGNALGRHLTNDADSRSNDNE